MKKHIPIVISGVLASGAGYLWHGIVSALLVGVYGAAIAKAALTHSQNRAAHVARTHTLDTLSQLSADLRAGLTLTNTAAEAFRHAGGQDPFHLRAHNRLRIAWRLAERTGAPLADVVDLLVADLRARERRRAQANAQLAGARATSIVLTALPAAGLGMGYAMGGNPLHVLFHTPIGAVCTCAALLLQGVGLTWVNRLVRYAAT